MQLLALVLVGLGIVAGLVMFRSVTWVLAATVGEPVEVRLGESCEVPRRGLDPSDGVTCDAITSQVSGSAESGTLHALWRDVAPDGVIVDTVDARIWNGNAYTRPAAMTYGAVAAIGALPTIGLTVTLALTLLGLARRPMVPADGAPPDSNPRVSDLSQRHRIGRATAVYRSEHFGNAELGLAGLVMLTAAAVVGAATTAFMAEDGQDTLIAAAVAVGVPAATAVHGMKLRARRRRIGQGIAVLGDGGMVVAGSGSEFSCQWRDAAFIGSPTAYLADGSAASFALRRSDGVTKEFHSNEWHRYDELRLHVHQRLQTETTEQAQ